MNDIKILHSVKDYNELYFKELQHFKVSIKLMDDVEGFSVNEKIPFNYFTPRSFLCICIISNFEEGTRKDFIDVTFLYEDSFNEEQEKWFYDDDYDIIRGENLNINYYCIPQRLEEQWLEYKVNWGWLADINFDSYKIKK